MIKKLFQPKRNRIIAAILAAVIAITTLALGLGSTFAAKPDVSVTLNQPNSYVAVEKGSFNDRDIVGAYRVSSGNSAIATASITGATVRVTGVSAGAVTISVGSVAGLALAVNYQVTDSSKISAYKVKNGGEVFFSAPGKNAASPVTTTPTAAFSTITWSSLQPGVATVSANGTILAVSKGAAVIVGAFTDKWGVKQDIHILVGVEITLGDDLLSELLEWIKKGEVILDLDDNPYTSDTLSDLQDAVNNGKSVLDLSSPSNSQLSSAIDEIKDAIDGLKKKPTMPSDVIDDGKGNYYRPIGDPKNVYMVVKPDGTPKHNPPQYVYDRDADGDGNPLTGGALEKANPYNGLYYVEDPAGSNIYKQVNSNGTLKDSPAIWGGPDGKFGGNDDQPVYKYGGAYYIDLGQNIFRKVEDPVTLGDMVGGGPDENPSTYPVTPIFDNTSRDGKYYVGPLGPYADGNYFFYGDKVIGGDGLVNSTSDTMHGTDALYYYSNGVMTTTPPSTTTPSTDTPKSQLASKTLGDIIVLDGIEWVIVGKSGAAPQPLWLLWMYDPTLCGKSAFGLNSTYEGSYLQDYLTKWYNDHGMPRLKAATKEAALSLNDSGIGIVGDPGVYGKNVLFPLGFQEVEYLSQYAVSIVGQAKAASLAVPKTSVNYWTRGAKSATQLYYITGAGEVVNYRYATSTSTDYYVRPAVWIDYRLLD
ncbi:MAG: Ig-like domain-containing protein [Oscillospiraceae bacterium]|jgi:hypothetical protein|nr:Ig-like domain-containing protein [Oscillospiraceae bacterium]